MCTASSSEKNVWVQRKERRSRPTAKLYRRKRRERKKLRFSTAIVLDSNHAEQIHPRLEDRLYPGWNRAGTCV